MAGGQTGGSGGLKSGTTTPVKPKKKTPRSPQNDPGRQTPDGSFGDRPQPAPDGGGGQN